MRAFLAFLLFCTLTVDFSATSPIDRELFKKLMAYMEAYKSMHTVEALSGKKSSEMPSEPEPEPEVVEVPAEPEIIEAAEPEIIEAPEPEPEVVQVEEPVVVEEKAPALCSVDGLYYKDVKSFIVCNNGVATVQACAPGSFNMEAHEYSPKEAYFPSAFCGFNYAHESYVEEAMPEEVVEEVAQVEEAIEEVEEEVVEAEEEVIEEAEEVLEEVYEEPMMPEATKPVMIMPEEEEEEVEAAYEAVEEEAEPVVTMPEEMEEAMQEAEDEVEEIRSEVEAVPATAAPSWKQTAHSQYYYGHGRPYNYGYYRPYNYGYQYMHHSPYNYAHQAGTGYHGSHGSHGSYPYYKSG